MDPALDPRLQQQPPLSTAPNQTSERSFDQSNKQTSYSDSTEQPSPSTKPDQDPSPVTSTPQHQQHQQHQYYGVPTPSSYSSETPGSAQQTYPYDNGLPQYGVPSGGVSYASSLPTVAEVAADLKRPRACEACRQLKVRCEPDDVVPGTCRRCFRSNRQCVVTLPSRKRQKKTDSRVAELEKKIDALTASLQAQHSSGSVQGDPSADAAAAQSQLAALEEVRSSIYAENHVGQWAPPKQAQENRQFEIASPGSTPSLKRKQPDTSAQPPKQIPGFMNIFTSRQTQDEAYIDVIDRGLIDSKTAYECFDHYVNDMAPILPLVVFPPGTKAEDIRKSKPILFLAIMSVSSSMIRPDLSSTLVMETMRTYSDRCVCRGEKSMEIVQALIVSTVWYFPPERYEELNFNQLIHIAAVMAIDIGMGKRMKPGYMGIYKEYVDRKAFLRIPDYEAPETRRTWLGCYYMCANAAMSLRRPLLIRWSGYMDDSLELLENSPNALPSDKWVVSLIRGQHIAEEVGFQFSMDDPTMEISITEPKTQYHLKAFERQLADWKNKTPKDMQNAMFLHSSHIVSLYVHEIAIHHNHNIDDFKPPYTVQPESNSPDADVVTPAHIDALTICIQSIHGAFDAILSMDILTLRSLPTLHLVRTSYAAVVLIKLASAISGPTSRFGAVFKSEDLKAEYYLDALIKHLRVVGEGERSRVAAKFSFIFSMLRAWFQKRNETDPKLYPPGADQKSCFGSVKNVFGQPTIQQDPSSSQWSSATSTKPANPPNPSGGNSSQSGLHMLSELASSSNTTTAETPASESHNLSAMGTWPQQYAGTTGLATEPYFHFPAMNGVDMDMMGFDVEDWNGFNSALSSDALWATTAPLDFSVWSSMQ